MNNETDKKTINFYVFGDSICFGQLISPPLAWVTKLAVALNNLPGQSVPVVLQNPSINGNTTRQALERMPYDVTSHRPDVLLIQFGMNDCNYWATDLGVPRVSRRAFSANLEEMVERALASGTQAVFLSTNHPSLKGAFSHIPALSHAQTNKEYNGIIRSVHAELMMKKYPVILVDHEKAWEEERAKEPAMSWSPWLLPDGIHLSVRGHELYAATVIPIVSGVVKGMVI